MKSESSQGGSLLKTGTVEEILELLGEESCEHRGKDRVEILEEICELETWDEQLTANILAAMKGLLVSDDEVLTVLDKVFNCLQHFRLPHVDNIIQQLLLLCCTKATALTCLNEICTFFSKMEKEFAEDERKGSHLAKLAMTEGMVLRHIMYSAKRSQEVGKTFVKMIQSVSDLTRFHVAIILSVAHIQRYQDSMFQALKSVTLTYLKDSERLAESKWTRKIYKTGVNLEEIISTVIRDSKQGWEYAVEGACEFGFILLETHLPKVSVVAGHIVSEPFDPFHGACKLGKSILMQCFEIHNAVRTTVFERVLNSLMTSPTSGLYFIDLIKFMSKTGPQSIIQRQAKVQELVERLAELPHDLSGPLVKTLLPIIKLIPTVRDKLIMALRKATFSRDLEQRKVSVVGFLQVLKSLSSIRSFSSSQISQSSSRSFASQVLSGSSSGVFAQTSVEAMNVEVVGCLKRGLSQQAEIREILYSGLAEVSGKNESLLVPILDVLSRQFHIYFEKDPELPPVRTNLWVSASKHEVALMEPMSHLLKALIQCLSQVFKQKAKLAEDANTTVMWNETELDDNASGSDVIAKRCLSSLSVFTERMSNAEVEDFGLDKSADYSGHNMTGLTNVTVAFEMLSLLEVLMEFSWRTTDFTVEKSEILLNLFKLHAKLNGVLKEKSVAAVKKAILQTDGTQAEVNNAVVTRAEGSAFSMECLQSILQRLICDQHPTKRAALSLLRKNCDFVRFLFDCALKNCHRMNQSPTDLDLKHLEFLFGLGRVMFLYYGDDNLVVEDVKGAGLVETLKLKSLEIYVAIYQITFSWAPTRFIEMLDVLIPKFKEEARSSLIIFKHAKINKMGLANSLMKEKRSDQGKSNREAVLLIQIMEVLAKNITPDDELLLRLQNSFILTIFENNTTDDNTVVKELGKLLLTLDRQNSDDGSLANRIGQNIHFAMGDSDPEKGEVPEPNEPMAIITAKTAATVLPLYGNFIDKHLRDASWFIAKVRLSLSVNAKQTSLDQTTEDGRTYEEEICHWLTILSNCLDLVVHSDLSQHVVLAYGLTRIVTKFYNTVASLVKHYLSAVQSDPKLEICLHFKKLINNVGQQFNRSISAFIMSLQDNQNQEDKKVKKAGGNLKAKVLRETKPLAEMSFAAENLGHLVSQLSKKLNVSLDYKFTGSVGFRVFSEEVTAAMEEEENGEEEQENSTLREDIDANETENDVDRVTQPTEPKSKKRRAGPQQEPGIKPKKAKKAKK